MGTKDREVVDVVIVGAGAAGLSAALFLLRARRSVIIYDEGKPRIAATPVIHEYPGFEGLTPAEFSGRNAKEIAMYGGEIRKKKVLHIEPAPGNLFTVQSDNETVVARTVLLATGLVDVLPGIPGLQEGWGKDVHVCPCFTGYELHDKRLIVFGLPERIGQLGKFLTAWSKNVTIITGHEFEQGMSERLQAAGVEVVNDEVVAIIRLGSKMHAVATQGGKEVPCDDVFISAPMRAASPLAASLCDVDEAGFAKTDAFGKTSREGLWVIGNANDPAAHLAHAAAAGVRVGPMITDYLVDRAIAEKM